MTPADELRQAAETVRVWAGNNLDRDGNVTVTPTDPKGLFWLGVMPHDVAEPLVQILDNLAHTWGQNEWDTNTNALELARRINRV